MTCWHVAVDMNGVTASKTKEHTTTQRIHCCSTLKWQRGFPCPLHCSTHTCSGLHGSTDLHTTHRMFLLKENACVRADCRRKITSIALIQSTFRMRIPFEIVLLFHYFICEVPYMFISLGFGNGVVSLYEGYLISSKTAQQSQRSSLCGHASLHSLPPASMVNGFPLEGPMAHSRCLLNTSVPESPCRKTGGAGRGTVEHSGEHPSTRRPSAALLRRRCPEVCLCLVYLLASRNRSPAYRP